MTNTPDELERAVKALTDMRDAARDGTPVTDPNEWEFNELTRILAAFHFLLSERARRREMTYAHTPGPWTVGQHPAVSSGWIVRPVLFGSRVRVLPEWEGGHVIIKSEADARLIASAPDLLEALKGLVALHDSPTRPGDSYAAARAAIRKATGEAS